MKPTLALRNFLLGSSLLAALLSSPAAFAGNTWDGGFGTGLWSDINNWNVNGLPNNTALTFAGNVQNTTNNDLTADLSYAGINFTNNNSGNTAAFTLAGNRITLGGNITTTALTVNGTITDIISLDMILSGNRIITTNQGSNVRRHNLTISGIISEDVAGRTLTKAGGADTILTLSNANTYSGSTTVSNGVLKLSHLSAIQNSTSVSVASGSTLQFDGPGTYVTAGTISIAGNGVVAGASRGVPTNSGALWFGQGGSWDSTVNAPINLTAAARIASYGNTMNQILGGQISGGVTAGSTALTISSQGGGGSDAHSWTIGSVGNASTYTGNTTLTDSGGIVGNTLKLGVTNALPTATTLTLAPSATAVITRLDLNGQSQQLAGLLNTGTAASARVFNSGAGTPTLTINNSGANAFSGNLGTGGTSFALTKTGAGDLTLGGANTYTGDTTISNGRIIVSTAANLSSGATTIIQSGNGQLFTSGTSLNYANNFNISTVGYQEPGDPTSIDGAIRSDGNNIFSGTITLSGNSRIGAYGNARVNTISGQITGNFAMSFYGLNGANNDTQTYIISNTANTYTGDTQIDNKDYLAAMTSNSTTLRLGASNVIPDVALGGNVVFGGVDANSLTILDLYGFNDTINGLTAANAAGARITNSVAGTSVLTIGANDTGSSFGGLITETTGTLAITKIGTNTLTLSNAANTYSGKTTVQNGTVSFSTGNATANANQQLGINTALDLGVAATSSGRLLYTGGAGTLAKNINALGNGTDTIENGGSGLLTLTGTLTKNGTTLTLKGGANGITVSGAGTITGSSANSDLIVNGGVVTLATANTYNGPTFIINGATLNANAANALPTSINRTAVSMDQTGSGSSALNLGASQFIASLTGAASSTLDLNANTLTIGTTAGTTTFAGVISDGTLTKDGASTQILSGANTYTGATLVSAGTLYVTGALSNSAVTVAATGTIGRNGAANGGLGNGLTIQAGGNLDLTGATLAANSSGILGITGSTLTLGNLAFTDLLGWDYANAALGTYELIEGGFTVAFGSTAFISPATAFDFGNGKKGYFTSGSLNAVIIPEPSAALLGGLGLLVLLRRRRN